MNGKNKVVNLGKLILFIILSFYSCVEKEVAPEKPFIIMYKYINSDLVAKGHCRYKYYDRKSDIYTFSELNDKYNIGDTIK